MGRDALELCQPHFCHALKTLYTVYGDTISDKFIFRMIDAHVTKPKLEKAIITRPSIRVYDRIWVNFSPYDTL